MGVKVLNVIFLILSLFCVAVVPQYPYSYCAAPNELDVTATNFTLLLVQTVTRHGDRTTLTELPGYDLPFFCGLTTFMFPSGPAGDPVAAPPRLFRKNYLVNRGVVPGDCNFGQLTSKGLGQHLALGERLRDLYVNTYKFLSPNLNTSEIWIRSTDIYRTLQSAQANMMGFFPGRPTGGNIPVVDMYTMDEQNENMFSNDARCPRGKQLYYQVISEPDYVAYDKSNAYVREKIADALKVSVDELPNWGDLFDAFNVLNCYNTNLPDGVTQDLVNKVYEVANWQYNYTLGNKELVKLWIGSFVKEILDRIQDKISGQISQKYIMYSGHDTTIAPLTTVFGVYDGRWPPYASHTQLELWSNGGDYYVQVKYQGIAHKLPNCPDKLCPLKQFLNNIQIYIPVDFAKECKVQQR